jgi:hypothetical protein
MRIGQFLFNGTTTAITVDQGGAWTDCISVNVAVMLKNSAARTTWLKSIGNEPANIDNITLL